MQKKYSDTLSTQQLLTNANIFIDMHNIVFQQ